MWLKGEKSKINERMRRKCGTEGGKVHPFLFGLHTNRLILLEEKRASESEREESWQWIEVSHTPLEKALMKNG